MEIVVHSPIYLKGSSAVNEDSMVYPQKYGGEGLEDNEFLVCDGGTGLYGPNDFGGFTGGQMVSGIVKRFFVDEDGPLEKRLEKANKAIQDRMDFYEVDTSKRESRWTATAAAIKIHDDFVECTQIGDSVILTEYLDGTCYPVAGYFDQDIELMVTWKEYAEKGMRPKAIFEKMKPDFIDNRIRVFDEIGNLNGEPESLSGVITGVIPTEGLKSLIIMTDGMVPPKEDPRAQNHWNVLFRLKDEYGFEKAAEYVRNLEESDPMQVLYPRLKMHDDIAAIAIDFKN